MSGQIFNLRKQEGLGIVTFDVAGEAMNTWTEAAIVSFREVLVRLEKSRDLIGVIFISGKPDHFFAGANLKMIEQMQNDEQVNSAIDPLHEAFNRLSALDMPTLAAINGVCAGGGLELSLACTARIATDAPGTLIGLPESKAGFFPGGGGTQRLPRLIGYQAVKLILQGDLLSAAKSHELGIIDRLTPSDKSLLEESITFLREIIAGKVNLMRTAQYPSRIDQVAGTARRPQGRKRA